MTGGFSGEPQAIWLTESGADRKMKIVSDFWFDDIGPKRWIAAAGTVVDGASIPQALWAIVGSPYTGDYRRASIVHDVACADAGNDEQLRRAADKMFYRACRAGGCSPRQATILYIGVRIGAWMNRHGLIQDVEQPRILTRQDSVDVSVREQFSDTAEAVLEHGESDDADVIERNTDAALKAGAQRRFLLGRMNEAMVARIPRRGSLLDLVAADPAEFRDIGFVFTNSMGSKTEIYDARAVFAKRQPERTQTIDATPDRDLFIGWAPRDVLRWSGSFVEFWIEDGALQCFWRICEAKDPLTGILISTCEEKDEVRSLIRKPLPTSTEIGKADYDLTLRILNEYGEVFFSADELAGAIRSF